MLDILPYLDTSRFQMKGEKNDRDIEIITKLTQTETINQVEIVSKSIKSNQTEI